MDKNKDWHDCGIELMAALRQSVKNPNVKLPGADKKENEKIIQFLRNGQDDNTIRICLGSRAIGLKGKPENMQENTAAFDAWALILRVHRGARIQLVLKGDVELPPWPEDVDILLGERHYNRFLYRLMKFEQFYGSEGAAGWFEIADPQLKETVTRFAQCFNQGSFRNNVGKDDAAKAPSGSEAAVEAYFAESGQTFLKQHTKGTDIKKIYRQLPVGLFWNKKGRDSYVFPGKKSATDLWGLNQNGDTLVIYELKATGRKTNKSPKNNPNKKVGIISELMFYCNYARDMYILHNNGFEPLSPEEAEIDGSPRSGYRELLSAYRSETLKKIQGYMLTDALHPLITQDVLKEMEESGITYHAIEYQWNKAEQVSDIKLEKINYLF